MVDQAVVVATVRRVPEPVELVILQLYHQLKVLMVLTV
jgi:hypothetical protein